MPQFKRTLTPTLASDYETMEPLPFTDAVMRARAIMDGATFDKAPPRTLTLKDLQPGDIFVLTEILPKEVLDGKLSDDHRDVYMVVANSNSDPYVTSIEGYPLVLIEAAAPNSDSGSCRISNIKGTKSSGRFPQSDVPLKDQPVMVLARVQRAPFVD